MLTYNYERTTKGLVILNKVIAVMAPLLAYPTYAMGFKSVAIFGLLIVEAFIFWNIKRYSREGAKWLFKLTDDKMIMRFPSQEHWQATEINLKDIEKIRLVVSSYTENDGTTSTETHSVLDIKGQPSIQLDCIPGLDVKRAIYVMKRNAPQIVDETRGYYK